MILLLLLVCFFYVFWWDNRNLELPPLDMFVTTADPVLEPPIITVNTVISLLSMDYPANKLACYLSDDAASPLTYFCLVEASEFAKLWIPFCKKYNVPVRAPFRYFSDQSLFTGNSSSEFQEDWNIMKVILSWYPFLIRLIQRKKT